MTNAISRKEENVINSCVLRSKDICILQSARISNRHTKFFVNRTLRSLRSGGYIKSIEEEIDQIIDDHKLSIARLLRPSFAKENIPFKVQRNGMNMFWFSTYDLKNGYVLLYKYVRKDTATHVLFLSDVSNPAFVEQDKIRKGEILSYPQVAHLLKDVEPVWKDKVLVKMINKTLKNEKESNS